MMKSFQLIKECLSLIDNYKGTLTQYLSYIINTDMNYSEIDNNELTLDMPVHPSEGSVRDMNGAVYVKLSE